MRIRKAEFLGVATALTSALALASCSGDDYPTIPSGGAAKGSAGVQSQGGAASANAGATGSGGQQPGSGGAADSGTAQGGSLGASGSPGSGGAASGGGPASDGSPSSGGQGQSGSQGNGGGSSASGGMSSKGSVTQGGSGGSGGASTGTASFAQVQQIITKTCGISGCHASGGEAPNLSNASTLYSTLTSTTVRQCGSDRMVTASDTANSALLSMVNGQCGSFRMPETCTQAPCLPTADITTIQNWIQQGAAQ